MLDEVHCKVLSVLKSDQVDAYLLSESSMFVFPHKLILKTCGTTTLLQGLHSLLRIAASVAGFPFHNCMSISDDRVAATPYRVFYSRKNFLHPEKQPAPHRSWQQEVKFLDDTFEGGSAYMVGKMNGDHWYLYMLTHADDISPPRTPETAKPPSTQSFRIPAGLASSFSGAVESNDETLEILMTDLDPENAKQFYLDAVSAVASSKLLPEAQEARQAAVESLGDLSASTATIGTTATVDSSVEEVFDNASEKNGNARGADTPLSEPTDQVAVTTEGHALGTVISDKCGLSDVYPKSKYPDASIDAYMFDPCGFSANGVIPAPQQPGDTNVKATHYFTVHVTPEPHCSYASFETNVPGGQAGRQTSEVIEHVVGIFKPGHFSVTLFEGKAQSNTKVTRKSIDKIAGYRRIDRIVHDFDDYELVFRYYERDGWVGGTGMRVGEEY
jgi:S-adenosylmethionine decarboxylase